MSVESGKVNVSWPASWRLELPDPPAPSDGWPVLVGLHGFGDDGPRLADRLAGLRGAPYARLWIDGPFPVEMREDGGRRIGRAWYQYDGDQERFIEALTLGRAFVDRVVDEVVGVHPLDPTRAVLLGYSMGGYVAGWTGLQDPDRWRGVVALATRVKSEALDPARVRGQRLLVVHGERDRFIDVAAAQASADAARGLGVEVTLTTWSGGHGLKPEVAPLVDAWVRDVFAIS